MEENNCVRCNKKYSLPNHPMAHFFVICPGCHENDPENIFDQELYNFKVFTKF